MPVVATMTDGTVSNSASVTVTAPAVVGITVSPSSDSVRVKRSRQFRATVTGTANTSVVWKVNGVVGGNNTVGHVSQSGSYTAPRGAVPGHGERQRHLRRRPGQNRHRAGDGSGEVWEAL